MDKIPADAMVVVADGESARVFRNVGADGALSLQQQEACWEQVKRQERDPAG